VRLLLAPGLALLVASCGSGDDAEDARDPAGGCRVVTFVAGDNEITGSDK
jgi:hypothetical protein